MCFPAPNHVTLMDRQTLNIQAIKSSWLQKSSIWTISVVNGETFRFSEEDSGEHFECSLESIEKYTRLVSIPFLSYAKIYLKIPKKNEGLFGHEKKHIFKIAKSTVPLWQAMQGPPTEQALAHSLKNAIKDTLLFGFFPVLNSLALDQDQEIRNVLISVISIIGIVFFSRKMPNAMCFLFLKAWEITLIYTHVERLIDGRQFYTSSIILYLLLGILISPFIYRRYADAYDDYKRFVSLMRG